MSDALRGSQKEFMAMTGMTDAAYPDTPGGRGAQEEGLAEKHTMAQMFTSAVAVQLRAEAPKLTRTEVVDVQMPEWNGEPATRIPLPFGTDVYATLNPAGVIGAVLARPGKEGTSFEYISIASGVATSRSKLRSHPVTTKRAEPTEMIMERIFGTGVGASPGSKFVPRKNEYEPNITLRNRKDVGYKELSSALFRVLRNTRAEAKKQGHEDVNPAQPEIAKLYNQNQVIEDFMTTVGSKDPIRDLRSILDWRQFTSDRTSSDDDVNPSAVQFSSSIPLGTGDVEPFIAEALAEYVSTHPDDFTYDYESAAARAKIEITVMAMRAAMVAVLHATACSALRNRALAAGVFSALNTDQPFVCGLLVRPTVVTRR
jgi:hypothetical protein